MQGHSGSRPMAPGVDRSSASSSTRCLGTSSRGLPGRCIPFDRPGGKLDHGQLRASRTDIAALAVNAAGLFAGVSGDGVLRSTDGGGNWVAVNTGLTSVSVQSLLASGTDLFVGTYDQGVFRSTDNGAQWSPASTGLTNTNVEALAWELTSLRGPGVAASSALQTEVLDGLLSTRGFHNRMSERFSRETTSSLGPMVAGCIDPPTWAHPGCPPVQV